MESISVVIPTIRGEIIQNTIKGLLNNTLLPIEIIIIDQGGFINKDFLLQFVSSVNFHLINDAASKGAARARNIGWKAAKGDIIAFIDDDAIPSESWIQSISDSFSDIKNNSGMVGGKITPLYKEKNPEWEIPKEFEFVLPAYNQGLETGEYAKGAFPASVNMAVRKSLMKAIGGFNENLGTNKGNKVQVFGEDTELAIRIKQSGFLLTYNPQAEVFHPVPLERQSEVFFRKRVFTEGYTKAYIDCNLKQFSITNLIYITFNELRKQIKLYTTKNDNHYLKLGKLFLSKGYLKGIIDFGFLKNQKSFHYN
jgi:glucosyl-dolichyl phosphate glucuronosyltransferase